MDALRVPLESIQQRMGHAVTGLFMLNVYGGKPERAVMEAKEETKRRQEEASSNL